MMTPAEEDALRMKNYDLAPLTDNERSDFEYRWTRMPGFGAANKMFALLFYRAGLTDANRRKP